MLLLMLNVKQNKQPNTITMKCYINKVASKKYRKDNTIQAQFTFHLIFQVP